MQKNIQFSLQDIEEKFVNRIKEELKWKNIDIVEGEIFGLRVQQVDARFEIDNLVDEEELNELVEIKYIGLVQEMYEGIMRVARQKELLEPYMDYEIGTVLRGLFAVNYDITVSMSEEDGEGDYEIGIYVEYVTYLMNPEFII